MVQLLLCMPLKLSWAVPLHCSRLCRVFSTLLCAGVTCWCYTLCPKLPHLCLKALYSVVDLHLQRQLTSLAS